MLKCLPGHLNKLFFGAALLLFFTECTKIEKEKENTITQIFTFKISGLNSNITTQDARNLEKTIKQVKGVRFTQISRRQGQILIRCDSSVKQSAIIHTIDEAGFSVSEKIKPKKFF